MNWLLQNFRERLFFSLRNPRYVFNSLYRELTLADERFISAITAVPARRLREFLGEPGHTPEFAARLRSSDKPLSLITFTTFPATLLATVHPTPRSWFRWSRMSDYSAFSISTVHRSAGLTMRTRAA